VITVTEATGEGRSGLDSSGLHNTVKALGGDMMRIGILALACAMAVGCSRTPQSSGDGSDTGIALARSGRAKDSLIRVKDSLLAEKSRQLSEQSQLIGDAATSARLVAEIDRDLSTVRNLRVSGDTTRAESAMPNASQQLAAVQRKVNAVLARLSASEARVRRMRSDSTSRAAADSAQELQLREYERSIGELRTTVDRQRLEIAMLTQRVDSVMKVAVELAARNDTMTARNEAMAAHEDSVFVAIGTERELSQKGIVRREGGTSLFFGRGKTLVPARSLNPASFQVMSKSRDLTIPMPRADRQYRVVSRQSLEFADPPNTRDAFVRGALRITDPNAFWAPSKYLILVQR
jgi:hypothetical protein